VFSSTAELVMADLDGDSQSDIVTHEPGSTEVRVQRWSGHAGGQRVGVPTSVSPCGPRVGVLVGSGDLDQDGRADLVFWDPLTHDVNIELLSRIECLEQVTLQGPVLPGAGWRLAGVGDTSGDGYPDLVWHLPGPPATERVTVWVLAPGQGAPEVKVSLESSSGADHAGWRIGAVADLDSDGTSDVIWHHASAGYVVAWLIDISGASAGKTLLGAGELNVEPGRQELVWRDPSGALQRWVLPGLPFRISDDFDAPFELPWYGGSGWTFTARAIDVAGNLAESSVTLP
jgi:hypothetical protein